MIKYWSIVFISVLAFSACDDSPPARVFPKGRKPIIAERPFPKEKLAPIEIPPPPAPYTGPKKFCFEMELGNNPQDMTTMQFYLDDNDSVTGTLNFNFSDRQPIRGNITGLKEGKIIEVKYAYTDSGKLKNEILALKMEGDKIYKKVGPLVEENGVLVLENPLNATLQLFLMQTECK